MSKKPGKKPTIKKSFNALSGRFYTLKLAAAANTGSVAMMSMMCAPLFLIDPTGMAFLMAVSGATTGTMLGLPAAFIDAMHDSETKEWTMRSGQKVSGPAYIKRQSEILQDAIIDLNVKRDEVGDKERAKINKILGQYGKYIAVMSKKVTIIDAGPYGASDKRLDFVKRDEILNPKPRQFKK